jgi:hypothetical protein
MIMTTFINIINKYLILFAGCIFLSTFTFGQETKKVLFIGNSYTFSNNLPQMLADVAFSVNDTVIFDSNTPGGYTLQAHSTNSVTLNKIMSGGWDFVVLQEQSQLPSFPVNQVQTDVFPYARILDSIINEYNPCAETMFFMTWGRKNGDAMNCANWPPVCTYEGMDSLLNLRYMMMAEMNDAVVSPVGAVWRFLRENHPGIELYSADESHPSVAGTYAASVCFYTSIFRKDPLQISFNSTLALSDANSIKSAVRTVVYDSLSVWSIGNFDPKADFWFNMNDLYVDFYNLSLNANEYFWDFGDGNTSADENPVHVYDVHGNYTVTLHAIKCSGSDVATTEIQITGIQTGNTKPTIEMYPNPVSDFLFLETAGLEIENIQVYDFTGKALTMQINRMNDGVFFNFADYPSGMYFLKVDLKDEKYLRKIIKQ